MDVRQELDALLANPECHAILVNALSDYIGALEESTQASVGDAYAAYFGRCVQRTETLLDLVHPWR